MENSTARRFFFDLMLFATERRHPEVATSSPFRDLCLEYLSDGERSPPEQMVFEPQLKDSLHSACDAIVYTVDSALLTTASGAAKAHEEFWAVLRAAMPPVYPTLSTPARTKRGEKHKRVLVLSLSSSESAGVQQDIGVLQLAGLLDVARVRKPWAIVQCRSTPSDGEFEFEQCLASAVPRDRVGREPQWRISANVNESHADLVNNHLNFSNNFNNRIKLLALFCC